MVVCGWAGVRKRGDGLAADATTPAWHSRRSTRPQRGGTWAGAQRGEIFICGASDDGPGGAVIWSGQGTRVGPGLESAVCLSPAADRCARHGVRGGTRESQVGVGKYATGLEEWAGAIRLCDSGCAGDADYAATDGGGREDARGGGVRAHGAERGHGRACAADGGKGSRGGT